MNKKTKLGAIVLFALVCASPVQACDWFDSLFGTINVNNEPVMGTMGAGGGGGDPKGPVDPN
ncbi:hypothetical protein KIH87_14200 [Paraneptunicella aestuarii]|uniref:hypothetical protein n=1 Tax=Paraneptunicella aestuarii TaxID=2831148 RepID=UPI001E43FD34|nr:hypothetical protein [Paraneptunicella aestuarii]UAA37842.1 hypothetical protein KIH87_14200 [Paraneptunicella aestuarii]